MASARIAVIGAGVIGTRHISVLASDPREFTLAAIADPLPKSEAVAERNGAPWFADYREMLAKELALWTQVVKDANIKVE